MDDRRAWSPSEPEAETFNPWTIVNLVFHHLAEKGLHPVLGGARRPGPPAAALLRALGIEPAAEGNRQVMRDVREHLADDPHRGARRALTGSARSTAPVSHV